MHLLIHRFDGLQQLRVRVRFLLVLALTFALIFLLFFVLVFFLIAGRSGLFSATQHTRDDIELLSHPFHFVHGIRSLADVIANLQLRLERCRQIFVTCVRIWVLHDGERLGKALSIHGKANSVFPRERHWSDFRLLDSPVQNRPRIAPAETPLFPDVLVFGRSRAQRNQSRRLVSKIPLDAIHSGAREAVDLSNDSSVRIQNFDFRWILRRSF